VNRLRAAWARVRAWRRIRFTAAGLLFTVGSLAVGFAAINTGNNLLHLLVGAMLGAMGVSGWLSERTIRGIEVSRRVPRGATVGQDVRIRYRLRNHKRRLASLALELHEQGLPGAAFAVRVPAGGETLTRAVNTFQRRGVHALGTLTLSTTFPFGLFRREHDFDLAGELVVWPRADRPVRPPRPGAGRRPRPSDVSAGAAAGTRGEYRGLRRYRPGDDPRDIHWRTSARLAAPVIREYEQDADETLWICLDLSAEPGAAAEDAVELAASLASRAAHEGRPFALVAGAALLPPGMGSGHLEAVLDALARVDFRADAPAPAAPVQRESCVLVSVTGRDAGGYADSFTAAGEDAA
jgi:uncharacterized protein (DUF58 family)